MSVTRALAVANAAPAPVIKSMALVPVATYAAPAAPQSKGSVTQNRLPISMRPVDEIRDDIFSFSMPQMVEEIAKNLCAEPPNEGGTLQTFATDQGSNRRRGEVLLHDHSLRDADMFGVFGHQKFGGFVDSVSLRAGGASRSAEEAMPLPEGRRAVVCQAC